MSRLIDGDVLFAVVRGHHDLYKGATNPADKARRDECLQVMCDINDAPTIYAIPVGWLKGLMLSTGDDVDKVEFEWIMREWQKKQEAR